MTASAAVHFAFNDVILVVKPLMELAACLAFAPSLLNADWDFGVNLSNSAFTFFNSFSKFATSFCLYKSIV